MSNASDKTKLNELKLQRRNLYHAKREYTVRLEHLQRKKKKENLPIKTQIENNLRQLFQFLCKQQRPSGKVKDFDNYTNG